MQALILAAGRGSRLGSVTEHQPKGLTKVLNKPLLQWQLDSLHGANVHDVAAATGYKKEKIIPFISKQFENEDWACSNMVASLMCCKDYLSRGTTIVSYSDIIYSDAAVAKLMQCESDIVIAYDPNWRSQWQLRFDNPLDDAESFSLNADGSLKEIGSLVTDIDVVEGQYMGLFRLSSKGFNRIIELLSDYTQAQIYKLDMTALFTLLLNDGVKISTLAIDDFWFEVDNQKDLAICERLLAKDR